MGSVVVGCCCCCCLRVWGISEAERSPSLVMDVDEVLVLSVGRGCCADIVVGGCGLAKYLVVCFSGFALVSQAQSRKDRCKVR